MQVDDSETRKYAFRTKLTVELDDEAVVRELVLDGRSFAINESQHFNLKRRIASALSVDANTSIFVVGSAKLGFSIAPSKRYIAFGDHSDIDVAVVDHTLYERVWHEAHEYMESGADWPKKAGFEKYLAWGWIRPDMLPSAPTFSFSNQWWEVFRCLQSDRIAGPYKVSGAIYHDISFLIAYQKRAIALCRTEGTL